MVELAAAEILLRGAECSMTKVAEGKYLPRSALDIAERLRRRHYRREPPSECISDAMVTYVAGI